MQMKTFNCDLLKNRSLNYLRFNKRPTKMNYDAQLNMFKFAYDTLLCAVCGSDKNVEFVKITDCNLCEKCNKELADGFESAMKMDRSDYPEL